MKQAMATEELVKWILFFFTLAALAVVTVIIANGLMQQNPVEKCRMSVATRGTAQIAGKPLPVPLNCFTRNIEIKEDGAYLNRKLMDKFGGDLDENIKRTVANEMYTCWYQFSKGQYNPFGKWWGVSDSICVICSEISFDDSVKNKKEAIDGFIQYLYGANIPTKNLNYSTYFFESSEKPTGVDERILTKQRYGVVFSMMKKENFEEFETGVGKAGIIGTIPAGCAIGAAIGVWGGGIAAAPGCVIGGVVGVIGTAVEIVAAEAHSTKEEAVPVLMFVELNTIKDSCDRLY